MKALYDKTLGHLLTRLIIRVRNLKLRSELLMRIAEELRDEA